MGAHSTHDKLEIRILSLMDNFFLDGCGQLASFTGIPCFWAELIGVKIRNRHMGSLKMVASLNCSTSGLLRRK